MSEELDDIRRSLQLHAAVDGELTASDHLAFLQECAADPDYARQYEALKKLKEKLRHAAAAQEAPAGLEGRVRAALEMKTEAPLAEAVRGRLRYGIAASFVIAMALGGAVTEVAHQHWPSPGSSIESAVFDDHRRSLLAQTPTDVLSSDQHTVKPWFDQRLALSPKVLDLSGVGFTLVGGRASVLGGVPVPTIVYRLRNHLISMMALPGALGKSMPQFDESDGFAIRSWRDRSFLYVVVSALPQSDLAAFENAYRNSVEAEGRGQPN